MNTSARALLLNEYLARALLLDEYLAKGFVIGGIPRQGQRVQIQV